MDENSFACKQKPIHHESNEEDCSLLEAGTEIKKKRACLQFREIPQDRTHSQKYDIIKYELAAM